jgi:leader peptidase (prepilin peptidase)/N-methyltransferase
VGLGWLAAVVNWGLTLTAIRVAVFGTVLLGVMLTDAEHLEIPDGFTVFGLLFGLVMAGVGTVVGEAGPFAGLGDALLGACVGAGAIAIIMWLGEVALKREAMGFGDVTLMAVIGAHVGPMRALITVFLGAFLGAVLAAPLLAPVWIANRRRGTREESPHLPFGVFLAPAAVMALLWWRDLASLYLKYVLRGM